MPQIVRGKDCFQKRIYKTIKAVALGMAIMALFLLVSAKEVQVNLSEDALLTITQSLYELADDGAKYSVQVKNEGQVLLKNVSVVDALPPGVLYIGPKSTSSLPLLKCIEHEDGITTKLTWYLEDIDTGQNKWVNFTIQKVDPSANLSLHEVRAEGRAFGYLIKGIPLNQAERYSAHVIETKAVDAFLMLLPEAIIVNATRENASIGNGMGV
ncbi:MAG: hypothetical protein NTU95_05340 [Methanothrix sp.]|nr:hypothetical protein [Methanothrix sp.]